MTEKENEKKNEVANKEDDADIVAIINIPKEGKDFVLNCPECNTNSKVKIYVELSGMDFVEVYLHCEKCNYSAVEKDDRLLTVIKPNGKKHERQTAIDAIEEWNEAINAQKSTSPDS